MLRLKDFFNKHNKHAKPPPPLSVEDAKVNEITLKKIDDESPWDRVKLLVVKDEVRNEPHPERLWMFWGSALAGCFGFTHGFVHGGRYGRQNFIKHNQLTVYNNQQQAQRYANDAYVLSGLKKGYKTGFLAFLGCYIVLFGAHIPEMYRCKSSSLHYVVSGTFVGTASQLVYGPRQMAIGALCGAYLGLCIGLLITYVQEKRGWLTQERHFRRTKAEVELLVRYGSLDIEKELLKCKSAVEYQSNSEYHSASKPETAA